MDKDKEKFGVIQGGKKDKKVGQDELLGGEDEAEKESSFQWLKVGDHLGQLKGVDWIIKGFIPADSLILVFGASESCKSFVAISMAASISTGCEWYAQNVKKSGAVFYIAGEGRNGMFRRFAAWQQDTGYQLNETPLFMSSASLDICDLESALEIENTIQAMADQSDSEPILIVVDTLARNFGAANENSTEDMNRFVAHLDRIRARWQATVMIVHHSGKDAEKGARGSYALHAAMDAEFKVTRDDEMVTLECSKMKDAKHPEGKSFKMREVDLGIVDDDGDKVTSLVLDRIDYVASPPVSKSKPLGKRQKEAIAALKRCLENNQANLVDAGRDPNDAKVSIDEWKLACGFERRYFHKIKASLSEMNLIKIDQFHVCLLSPPN